MKLNLSFYFDIIVSHEYEEWRKNNGAFREGINSGLH
jgi:hypothetical protein